MFWSKKPILNLNKVLMFVACLLWAGSGNASADFIFGTPTNLGQMVNSTIDDVEPSISVDGLELYFGSYRPGGLGDCDIWVTKRATVDDEWGEAINLGPLINSSAYDGGTSLSPDGLSLYFTTARGNGAVMATRRDSKSESWGTPEIVYRLDEWGAKGFPSLSSDNLEMYVCEYYVFDPDGFGLSDLWVSTRSSDSDAWNVPQNLGPIVNSSAHDRHPNISADGLALFFSSDRPGGYGEQSPPNDKQDIWVTTRANENADWGTPMNLGPTVNTSVSDGGPSISADGHTLYFYSRRPGGYGGYDIWQVSIDPVVDFTGDYRVDIEDLLILIEHWGQNAPAYDMGPTPWGDGVVDAADLEVFMSYWDQELPDSHFLANWKLDETEGMHAEDSIGDNHGIVIGNPAWQPEAGQVNGALELDGIDDVIILKPVLNPKDGPFSAFAWVQGGAPGQVILSQQTGVNWLQVDTNGMLMTELAKSGGRTPGSPLYSETVITDGNWHHVGFVWDGAQRILYVDDIPVALDDQASLGGATGGLVIGSGTGSQAGTFWSGLIDDVRIHDRVVEP